MAWRWKCWRWLQLGARESLFYYRSSDRVAALRTRSKFADAEEDDESDRELWMKTIDNFCSEAARARGAYIRLPPGNARSLPPILRVEEDGIWLANDDFNVVRIGRMPPDARHAPASCTFDYVADVVARLRAAHARVQGVYVRVLWRSAGSQLAAIFHFTVHDAEVIVAQRG